MKKFLMIAGLIFLAVATAFSPVNHEQNDSDVPFNAYCPIFTEVIPASFLEWALDNSSLRSIAGEQQVACALKVLLQDGKRDSTKIYLDSTLLINAGRADLAAYFLSALSSQGESLAKADLGILYADGNGVAVNKEKAKHLLRSTLFVQLPVAKGDECATKVKTYKKEQYHPLKNEQIDWFQSLCYKTTEELLEIAEWYVSDKNPYQSPGIAYKIFIYLHVAHRYDPAWVRAEEVWQKFWPNKDGLSPRN